MRVFFSLKTDPVGEFCSPIRSRHLSVTMWIFRPAVYFIRKEFLNYQRFKDRKKKNKKKLNIFYLQYLPIRRDCVFRRFPRYVGSKTRKHYSCILWALRGFARNRFSIARQERDYCCAGRSVHWKLFAYDSGLPAV